MQSIKLSTAQARPIVKATFPDYKGRKFSLEFTNHVSFYNVNWSSGSKNEYRMVRVDGNGIPDYRTLRIFTKIVAP